MTGGGFGGCAISVVNTDYTDSIATRVKKDYFDRTGITPSIYPVRPSGGATVIR
jgi:galactokinase